MIREGWTEVPLSDLVDLIIDYRGKTPKKLGGDWQDSGVPAISAKNIKQGRIINEDDIKYVSEELYKKWMKHELAAGDVLLTSEAPLGETCFLKNKKKMVLSQRIYALRAKRDRIFPRFLCYYLESPEGQAELKSRATGATAQGIRQSLLREVTVRFPSNPSTQLKIAAVLSTYDDLIENNARRIRILEEMARTLYREWFVNFRFPGHEKVKMVESELGPIPEGWEVNNYTDIIDVLSGGTPKTLMPEYWNGNIPWFTPRDLRGSFFVIKTARQITELGLRKCNSDLYPAGTVFITARGTVGRCVLTGVPMAMSQTSYALRGHEGIPQAFVFFLTLGLVNLLKKKATGAVFDTIVVDTFRKQSVVVPPRSILKEFAGRVTPILSLIKTLQLKNDNLRQTRDLSLPKLISGELNVSELDIATEGLEP